MADWLPHRVWQRRRSYLIAAASCGVALGLTLLLDDPRTEPNTLLILLFAVMLSSWQGGWGPGLLALALTASAGAWLLLLPTLSSPARVHGVLMRLGDYIVVSLLIIHLNSARRAAQRRAEDARAVAESASRAREDFLAVVSHELRTPINSIIGWAGLLHGGGLDQTQQERAVQIIERSARAQARLIEDLLDASRIIKGKLRLEVGPVDLSAVVNAAVEIVRPAAEAKMIELRREAEAAGVEVVGDADRLQQALWNLLANAIKFTPAHGRVEIRLERTGAQARVSVTDTGRGIAPEFLPHVFEQFSQSEAASRRGYAGLGLGLAITRHLVELHGGRIEAHSPGEGGGATFVITLPLSAGRKVVTAATRPSARQASGVA
jgi:signal transduction histidine kinase